jgi:integrase
LQRLSPAEVAKKRDPGYYPDGGGLYLQVSPARTRSWIYRFTLRGRSREMGLGSLNAVGLADARRKASECRGLLAEGTDPIEARDAQRAQDALTDARSITFAKAAERYVAAHKPGWRNAKHADQWENTLETYAEAVIGRLPVADVDTSLVLRVLEPIWTEKPETASRLRGRIEAVLDWATVRGHRTGDNPARWRGHLAALLPARSSVAAVKHHAALPYASIGDFVAEVRKLEGVAARALEFTILTAARTGEVIGATPGEFDLQKALWTIPAERMKARREHRTPLSPRALEIVREQIKGRTAFVFSGQREGRALSNMAMLELLKRTGHGDLTVHGFRSTFRDWAAEQTAFPHELAEMALAHAVGDKVEAAYRRGDMFAKRARLMAEWAKWCERTGKAGKVTPLRRSTA